MSEEITIRAELDPDDPRVIGLVVDRDIGDARAAASLFEKLRKVPGIVELNLVDSRELRIRKADDFKKDDPASRALGQLIREHLRGLPAAGAPAAERPSPRLQELWGIWFRFDRDAAFLKAQLGRQRWQALLLTAASAIFGLLSSQAGLLSSAMAQRQQASAIAAPAVETQAAAAAEPRTFSPGLLFRVLGLALAVLAGLAAAGHSYYTASSIGVEREQEWLKARGLAEKAFSEGHLYLCRAGPYDADAKTREERLGKAIEEFLEAGEPILPGFELPSDADWRQAREKSPDDARLAVPDRYWSMDDYLARRVDDQTRYYQQRAKDHREYAEAGRARVMIVGSASAAFGAIASPLVMFAGGRYANIFASAAWMPILTTVSSAVTTYHYQNRLHIIHALYERTAHELRALRRSWDRLDAAQRTRRGSEFVEKFEKVLTQEHEQWASELSKPGGGPAPAPAVVMPAFAAPPAAAIGVIAAFAPTPAPTAMDAAPPPAKPAPVFPQRTTITDHRGTVIDAAVD